MKSVYVVKERSIINKRGTEFCGLMFYSSYEKALKDYNRRVEIRDCYEKVYNMDETDYDLKSHESILQISDNYQIQIILEQHEVF